MSEPDVALTDYALTLLAGFFAVLVLRRGDAASALRGWFALFFAAAAGASLFGGSVHGFFPNENSQGHALLWPATLLSLGVATWSGWAVGAHLVLAPRAARLLIVAAALQLLGYSAVVLSGQQEFVVAVINYLPAALFMLGAVLWAQYRDPELRLSPAAWGLVLTFVAAGVQRLGLGLHPQYFNHNALYHLVQALGLALIFWGCRSVAGMRVDAIRHADAT